MISSVGLKKNETCTAEISMIISSKKWRPSFDIQAKLLLTLCHLLY